MMPDRSRRITGATGSGEDRTSVAVFVRSAPMVVSGGGVGGGLVGFGDGAGVAAGAAVGCGGMPGRDA
jgi:hypothetical protein